MSRIPGPPSESRLGKMQAQFQQKQSLEKEAKLLQMLDNQQQRASESAAGVINKLNNINQYVRTTSPHPLLNNANSTSGSLAAGKVRQMFEERRKGGPLVNGNSASNGRIIQGIDKSHPLEPIQVTPTGAKSPVARVTSEGAKRSTIAPPIRPSNLGSGSKPLREPAPTEPIKTTTTRSKPPPRASPITSPLRPRGSPSPNNEENRTVSRPRGTPERSKVTSPARSRGSPSPAYAEEEAYPPVARTTKYSDYASELEKREASLANKLQGVTLNGSAKGSPTRPKPSSPSSTSKVTLSSPSTSSKAKSTAYALKPAAALSTTTSKKTAPVKKPKSSSGPPPGSEECKICSRYFASDRIAKHESICKKVGVKKRKVFDPTKMRMQGTEAEPYIRIVSAKSNSKKPAQAAQAKKKADWRKKHEEFINTIRLAKEYQTHVARGGDPNDLPPPPPSENADYVQCPHCNRKFSEGAAERHIPKCQNIKSNKR